MTTKDEALKLALEAICGSGEFLFNWHDCEPNNEREIQSYQETLAANEKAFNAIREALAQSRSDEEQPAPFVLNGIDCSCGRKWRITNNTLTASEPAQQQEPVVRWVCKGCRHEYMEAPSSCDCMESREYERVEYFTAPPANANAGKPWVGLTDDEFQWIYDNGRTPAGMIEMAEAKLKEKNT